MREGSRAVILALTCAFGPTACTYDFDRFEPREAADGGTNGQPSDGGVREAGGDAGTPRTCDASTCDTDDKACRHKCANDREACRTTCNADRACRRRCDSDERACKATCREVCQRCSSSCESDDGVCAND